MTHPEKEILEELCKQGLLGMDMKSVILSELSGSEQSLYDYLTTKKLITESDLINVISALLGFETHKFSKGKISQDVLMKISPKFVTHYSIMPVAIVGGVLQICVSDPMNLHLIDDLKTILEEEFLFVLAPRERITSEIKKHYGLGAETVQAINEQKQNETAPSVSRAKGSQTVDLDADASAIVQFVNQLFLEAKKLRATDIHIEPFENELRIRYRVDGILMDANVPSNIKEMQSLLTTRIKIMANLDISEHRLFQDGRIKVTSAGEDLDLRISILPTPFGESLNVRFLSTNILMGIEAIGFEEDEERMVLESIEKPYGIVLLTGPTGSGKTSTLYAALSKINDGQRKIITIEDPIEYQMKGITQIQVYPKIGLTFAGGLRSMLRHDPDIMMVGEVRDLETADIAMRVSMTGHLVFTTLHTNDAPGAVSRLVDMGVEQHLVSSCLELVIAQRLVRKICDHCRTEDKGSLIFLESQPIWAEAPFPVYKGSGCDDCQGTGYLGRVAIHEMFKMDDEIRHYIAKSEQIDLRRFLIEKKNFRTLRENGLLKVKKGITTVEEVIRMTNQ